MGLFSKKPGGTLFGNLLRGVASSVTDGVLGTGANRIEVGQTKTNAQLAQEAADLSSQIAQSQAQVVAGVKLGNGLISTVASDDGRNFVGVGSGSNVFVWVFAVLVGVFGFKYLMPKKWK